VFEKASDSDDSQAQMFLAMMGVDSGNARAADPRLVQLLRETQQEVMLQTLKTLCSKADKPHLWDFASNIMCGNCEKVGPTLKRCACRKAYYCSAECQRLQWAAQKSDHKEAMRKKNAKNGKT
jgi:MYND finger